MGLHWKAGTCPLVSACPGHPWVLEASLRTEQRQEHLVGIPRVVPAQELASILGLSIPFCRVPSAVAGGHAEGIPPLGLGILTRLPPGPGCCQQFPVPPDRGWAWTADPGMSVCSSLLTPDSSSPSRLPFCFFSCFIYLLLLVGGRETFGWSILYFRWVCGTCHIILTEVDKMWLTDSCSCRKDIPFTILFSFQFKGLFHVCVEYKIIFENVCFFINTWIGFYFLYSFLF